MNVLFFVVPIVVALICAAAYYSYTQQRKRREEFTLVARELGWRFDPLSDKTHTEKYGHFSMFRQGHSQVAYNSLAGAIAIRDTPWPAKMGDFEYKITSSNGKTTTTHTHRFSYLIVHTPFVAAPDLFIRRENFFDSVSSLFGLDDIDFESAEFSRQFYVKSADKRFAYGVIHTELMDFMLNSDTPTLEFQFGQCLFTTGTETWPTGSFCGMAEWARRFFELWPRHVVAQLEQKV